MGAKLKYICKNRTFMRHKEYKKGIFLVILSICFYQNDILNFSDKSLGIVFSTLQDRKSVV